MGHQIERRSGVYIQQPAGYRTFIPNILPPKPDIRIEGELKSLLSRADTALARLDGAGEILPAPDVFIPMFVRKEALLSSRIEDIRVSLDDILALESGYKTRDSSDVREVLNYIKALNRGIDDLKTFPISISFFKDAHAILFDGVRGGNCFPGELRHSQNWVGAPCSPITEAEYVPPPPFEAYEAMGSLERYFYDWADLPVLIDCALVHYQFLTIRPFLHGNGRMSRMLITFFLASKGVMRKPLLCMSSYFQKNRQEYFDRLMLVRNKGDYEQWIEFFLKGVIEAAESTLSTTRKILELHDRHQRLLWELKASSSAGGILDLLFYSPFVSVGQVAEQFNLSFPGAVKIIEQLEAARIIREVTGRKRDKRYAYGDYLDILNEGIKV